MRKFEVETPRVCEVYRHPMELAYHARLSALQRRAMLDAWADLDNADAENPMLRRDPRSGVSARVDEIEEALRALHEETMQREAGRKIALRPEARRVQPGLRGSPFLAAAE